MNRVPKFGNDNGYVDSIAVRLLDDFTSIIERLRTTEAKGLILGEGIATFEFFAKWGHDVGVLQMAGNTGTSGTQFLSRS